MHSSLKICPLLAGRTTARRLPVAISTCSNALYTAPTLREPSPDPPAPIAHEVQEVAPEVTVTPGSPGLPPARLARGLASFSRENAQREKKFAHLLRDAPPAAKKPPPGSGNPG
jgi:hypothetical protein